MNRQQWLKRLTVGDKVVRLLSGIIPIAVEVIKIEAKETHDEIICGPIGGSYVGITWVFHGRTGCEIDHDVDWDGTTKSGSYLVPPPSFYPARPATSRPEERLPTSTEA